MTHPIFWGSLCAMNTKSIVLSIVGIGILFGALYGVYSLLNAGPDPKLIEKIKTEKPQTRTLWNREAGNTLAVMSDYQCPACKVFHEHLATFTASDSPNVAVTKKVAYVFRYFPLYQIHDHTYYLAYAAEAAARQGKFEEMSTRFFSDQSRFTAGFDIKKYVAEVAMELELNMDTFNKDINDGALQGVIQADLHLAEKLGVNATPTFFLNGQKLESMSPADLTKLLQDLK